MHALLTVPLEKQLVCVIILEIRTDLGLFRSSEQFIRQLDSSNTHRRHEREYDNSTHSTPTSYCM